MEVIQSDSQTNPEERVSEEMPMLLIAGALPMQSQRLAEAAQRAGFQVHRSDSFDTLPPRSELDPDLIVITSDLVEAGVEASLPASFRSRLVMMVGPESWPALRKESDACLISQEASDAELQYRLLESLQRIQQRNWARLGLPVAQNQEALWELIPSTDWVTGLDNRLRFLQELQKNISRSKRYKRPFCCLLVRFDNHTTIIQSDNGKEQVNMILEEVAGVLEVSVRDADFLARMHHDLFGILLPETDLDNGQYVVRRIENNLKQFQFAHPCVELPSFSCGLSSFDHETSTADSLLQDAQNALDVT